MNSADLSVPIYLNQQIVFDLLAMPEDGFCQLSTLTSSKTELQGETSITSGSVGVRNVFAFLGISLSGAGSSEKTAHDRVETVQSKVHTPASLFAKLRARLGERGLLRQITSAEAVATIAGSEFIEFKALLRKNPLLETVQTMKEMADMASVLGLEGKASIGGKPARSRGHESASSNMKKEIEGMLTALTKSNTVELIGELLDAHDVTSVLTTRVDFFNQGDTSEIIDGEFRVLGKAVRVIRAGEEASINLLRKTTFGKLTPSLFNEFARRLNESEEHGLKLPKMIAEIQGPAIQVLPIAIFA